jgi:hypothetical protein
MARIAHLNKEVAVCDCSKTKKKFERFEKLKK